MQILLHVGLPKTGTTSFQHHLMQAYGQPVEGTWYPPFGQTHNQPMHFVLGQSLRNDTFEELDHMLKGTEGRADRLVLSDESIFVETPGLTRSAKDTFRTIMSRYDITVVSVERDMERWKRSFYIQCVELRRRKIHLTHDTANTMWQTGLSYHDFFASPYVREVCDVEAQLREIANISAAKDHIRLKYEDNPDSVALICTALGLQSEGKPFRSNMSLRDVETEILRQANRQTARDGRMIRALIRLKNGLMPRRRVQAALREWRGSYDWSSLRYMANPPLVYTGDEFHANVDALRASATDLK